MSELWKKRLLPASFRGIPFFVDEHELKGGRNVVAHEPPDLDKTFAEDIGRKSKVFKITGHVLGDNYFFIRDGLIRAMEDQGKGILIHPYLGAKEVQPESYTIKENTLEGRIAFFDFVFIEAGDPSFPLTKIDDVIKFITTGVVAVAQVKNAFQVAFKLAELPGFAVESAQAMVTDFIDSVESGFNNVRLKPEEQASLTRSTRAVRSSVAALVRNPASLAAEIDSIIEQLKDVVTEAPESFTIDTTTGRDEKLDIFTPLLTFSGISEDIPETTPTRIQEKANAVAIKDLVNQLAIIRVSEQTVEKEFKTIDAAIEQRELITDLISIQLNSTPSDEVFQALSDLNSTLVEAVPNQATGLADTRTINLDSTVPSLVLTYDLYQDLTNEKDIIDRNKIRNPAFISGELEVLSG